MKAKPPVLGHQAPKCNQVGVIQRDRGMPTWRHLSIAAHNVALAAASLALSLFTKPAGASESVTMDKVTSTDVIQVIDFSGLSISPDGRYLAVRTAAPNVHTNSVRLAWHILSTSDGRAADIVADAGEPMWDYPSAFLEAETPIWSPDSQKIYFRAIHGEECAIWALGIDGKERKLTSDPADVDVFVVDSSGAKILYQVRATRTAIRDAELREYETGVLIDQSVDTAASITRNFFYHGRAATLRDRGVDGPSTLLSDASPIVETLDLATGTASKASAQEIAEFHSRTETLKTLDGHDVASNRAGHQLLSRGATGIAFACAASCNASTRRADPPSEEMYQLRWVRTSVGESMPCIARECTLPRLRGLGWRNDREILFVKDLVPNGSALYAWDIRTNRTRAVFRSAGLLGAAGAGVDRIFSAICPGTANYVFCTTSDASSPPQLVRIDISSGVSTPFYDPNIELRARVLGHSEHISWMDKWGRRVTGVLVLPQDYKPPTKLPLVITSYNCNGFLRGGVGFDVPEHVLAGAGIAALCVNFDTESTYGVSYPSGLIPAGQRANLQSILDSWESGVDFLDKRKIIDPSRVGVSGLSLGAEAVHYATTHSRHFSVASATAFDIKDPFAYYFMATHGGSSKETLQFYALPDPLGDWDKTYSEISPASNVANIYVPVLIQTAEAEFRWGLQYYVEMHKAGKPLEIYVYPDEAHNFMQPSHRASWNDRFIEWFRFWLMAYEDPDPAKRSQYERWAAMRDGVHVSVRSQIPSERLAGVLSGSRRRVAAAPYGAAAP